MSVKQTARHIRYLCCGKPYIQEKPSFMFSFIHWDSCSSVLFQRTFRRTRNIFFSYPWTYDRLRTYREAMAHRLIFSLKNGKKDSRQFFFFLNSEQKITMQKKMTKVENWAGECMCVFVRNVFEHNATWCPLFFPFKIVIIIYLFSVF